MSAATAKAPVAAANVSAAQAAVQVPQSEDDARAAEQVVTELSEKEKPSIEIEQLCKRIRDLIVEKRPADEDAVIDTRPAEVAKEAGQGVSGDVQKNVNGAKSSYGPIDATPRGPQPATPPPIGPMPPVAPTPDVTAAAASPDAIPADQVSLDQDTQAMQAKAHDAGLDGEAAQLVTTGPVAEARAAHGDLTTLAKDGPGEALRQQQAALARSDQDMAALQAKAIASLKDARAHHVSGVQTQQLQTKGGEEGLRARLSKQADDIYTKAQGRVKELLKDVPETAMAKWNSHLPPLTSKFNDDLKVVKGQIAERHSGIGGFFVAGWDAVTGLPDWVQEAYDTAEKNFGDGVCALITEISSDVNTVIKLADGIIDAARSDINAIFTQNLPDDQKAWAAEQLKAFGKKLDTLHEEAESTRSAFNKELIENAGNAVQAAREQIQKLRKEARGIWGRFVDAVGRFLDDPVKFIVEGLLELLGIPPAAFWAVVDKVKKVISDIVDAPIKFANNLMSGIGDGFSLFFEHIGKHLLEGLLEWLLGGLREEGITIEVPRELSLRSVVVFFLQLLGISWARIRKLLVAELGEKPVALIETAAGVIQTLATKGLAGIFEDIERLLDPQTIINTIVETAVKYVTEMLIVKVAQKILMMLNPAGAILAAIEAIYRVLKWVFHNAAKIFHLIEAVVNGLADVIAGNVSGVAKMVEDALAALVAPVIDFLADYFGLGDLPGKVAEAVKGLQTWVEGVLRNVIKWLVEMGKKALAALGFKGKEGEDQKPAVSEIGERVPFEGGGEAHEVFIQVSGTNAVVMISSEVTTIESWLNEREAQLRLQKTKKNVKEKAPALISEARNLAGITDKKADLLAVEVKEPAAEPTAPTPEKIEQDQNAVVQEERTLVGVLKEIADLFGIAAPIVVKAVVPRSSLQLTPPLRRQLVEDLAAGSRPLIYLATRSDETLIANLIETDSEAFEDGTLQLPVLDETAIRSARDIETLGGRVGRQTFVRRVGLQVSAEGFSVSAGYDVVASGLITGPRMLTEKERIEKFSASSKFAAAESPGRFKPIQAQAPAYPRSSNEPFTSTEYMAFYEDREKVDRPNANQDLKSWLEMGAAGRLSRVGSEGSLKFVITGGSVYETPVADTLSDAVDPKLRAAVEGAGGIVEFMNAIAEHKQVGEITYEQFTQLWERSVNSNWLKDEFRAAAEGMHEWIPSNYIPDTIARAAEADSFADGAAWIKLHHMLRTDTALLIFKPEHWWLEEGPISAWIPQGHSGAVYVESEPQTSHQNLFHNKLREAFDESKGIHSCIKAIREVFEAWIWDGSGGKTPIYPNLRSKNGPLPDGNALASYQAKNYKEIESMFDRITAEFAKAKT